MELVGWNLGISAGCDVLFAPRVPSLAARVVTAEQQPKQRANTTLLVLLTMGSAARHPMCAKVSREKAGRI